MVSWKDRAPERVHYPVQLHPRGLPTYVEYIRADLAGTLTEEMEQAGFDAIDEYERWKVQQKFPRPSLIAHIWTRMISTAAEGAVSVQVHLSGEDEDLSHDFEDHDCGEDVCVCDDPAPAPLSEHDQSLIDRAWEYHKAAAPVATVINDNQPGWTAIIETSPNVTLEVGTKLYAAPVCRRFTSSGDEPAAYWNGAYERMAARNIELSDALAAARAALAKAGTEEGE